MILRLVSYNIRLGGRGREQALATVLAEANPDLVLFQEARDPGVIEQLSRDSGLPHWGARPGLSLGFMSRRPTSLAIWHKPRVSRHAFLEIELEGIDWRFFGVHLSAVHAAWTEQRRLYELRALLTAIGRQQPGPHSLAGDFNTVAPGELLDLKKLPLRLKPFVWMSGGDIRWRTIQQVLDAGYVDVGRHVLATVPPVPNAKPAVINTFPTWDPHQRLDYLFVPGGYVDRVRSCGVITNSATREASDHFPLVAEIDVSSSIA